MYDSPLNIADINIADFDRFIGRQLRVLRVSRGYSLVKLAKALNISYQQVQKYEAGTNRLTAGRIWQLTCLFNIQPQDLFEAVRSETYHPELRTQTPPSDTLASDPLLLETSLTSPPPKADIKTGFDPLFVQTVEEMKLMIAFKAIKSRHHRKHIVELAQALETKND